MERIVDARNRFYANLPEDLAAAIERYDPEKYSTARLADGQHAVRPHQPQRADGPERVRSIVRELLDTLGLYDEVMDIGLDFNVGVGGRRLTSAQRQKMDVARTLMKRADFIILNRPFAALDQRAQDLVTRNVLEEARRDGRDPAIILVLPNPTLAKLFERSSSSRTARCGRRNARDTFGEKRYLHRIVVLIG